MKKLTHNSFLLKYLCDRIEYDGGDPWQCVDLAKAYADSVWRIKPGSFNGAAKNANQSTFPGTKIILPGPGRDLMQGDILIQDAFPGNKYGHVGVVHKADAEGYWLMEQNGEKGSSTGTKNDAIRLRYYTWKDRVILRFFRK